MSPLFCLLVLIVWLCKSELEENDYKLVKAETRNIIFVGRSRTGKTTLIHVLKNKDYFPPLFTILRGTEDVTSESFTMRVKGIQDLEYKQLNLQFNIMDTPGLFERTLDINDKRTNEIILDTITKCIELEITKINHVYFVMSIQRGLNDQDLESFRLFTELFLGMEQKISIILSFSQNLSTQKQYDHYRDQFKNVPDLQELYHKINGRIFFLGAVQKGSMYDVAKLQKNVYSQRRALFEHIIKQRSSYNLKKLKIYQDYLSLIRKVRNTLAECCTNMQNCIDIPKFDSFISHYTDFVQANVRNIILIGGPKAGKTTLIEVLKDRDYAPDEWWSMFTKTEECTIYSIDNAKNVDINIMDTPGFIHGSNELYIKKCLQTMHKIHHIYFVMSVEQGLNRNDIAAFHLFSGLLAGMEVELSVILSFSQTLTNAECDSYRDEFKNEPDLKDLYETIQGRIFFLGAAVESGVNIIRTNKNVYAQRDILLNHFRHFE